MKTHADSVHADVSDAELVAASLNGGRDDFAKIVARYQSLVCSVGYSATGDLSLSEELAQETFVTAWKQLQNLRDPTSLRPWLCGIARNLTHNSRRRRRRDPAAAAASLDETSEVVAVEPSPADQAVTNEEAAILWQSLEKIPEIYREPLVLFYREHRSVKNVAELLDLSEETAKQRLSRGRKLLHEQVLGLVESVLVRSTPGRALTIGILAALPVYGVTSTATAASLSAAGVGGAGMKAAGIAGLAGAILGPLAGILGAVIGFKASLAEAQSERERRFIRRMAGAGAIFIVIYTLGVTALMWFGFRAWSDRPLLLTWTIIGVTAAYVIALFGLIFFFNHRQRVIRKEEGVPEIAPEVKNKTFAPMDYCSRRRFLGMPLVCIRMGTSADGSNPLAVGWIAMGGKAIGGLFAFGGLAVAPVAFGGFSVGFLSLGGLALGLLTWGGMTFGVWATGGVAIGYLAFGGVALAWEGAMGGVAVAREFALGGIAHAVHINDATAQLLAEGTGFFRVATGVTQWAWLVAWGPLVLFYWHWLKVRPKGEQK